MVEAPTTDRPLEPASSKLDAEVAETDHMADADGAEENGGAGAADPAAAQKTPATAKKAKAKRIDVEPDKIVAGSRHRKSVEHYKVEDIHITEKLMVEPGEGEKLSELPNVAFKLSKLKARDKLTEMIHMLLFKRKGEVMKRKRDIGEFSGFIFTDDDRQKEQERASEYLHRFTTDGLHQLMDILDLPRGADKKDAKVDRVLKFLEKPSVTSTKDLASQAAKNKAAVKRKRESKPAKAARAAQPQEDEQADDDMEDAAEEEEEADEEEPEEKPKPKRAAKSKAKGKTAAPKPKTASKGRKKAAPAQEEVEDGDDEDDDMPLAAAAKKASAPSDEELVTAVEAILAGEDVQRFNIKDLMRRLKDKYGLDLFKQKPIIKATAIRYCQEHAPRAAEEVEPAAEEVEVAAGMEDQGAAAADEEQPGAQEAMPEPDSPDEVAADEEQPADAVDNGIVDHDEEAKDAGEEPATAPEELVKQDAAAQEAALAAGNGEEPE